MSLAFPLHRYVELHSSMGLYGPIVTPKADGLRYSLKSDGSLNRWSQLVRIECLNIQNVSPRVKVKIGHKLNLIWLWLSISVIWLYDDNCRWTLEIFWRRHSVTSQTFRIFSTFRLLRDHRDLVSTRHLTIGLWHMQSDIYNCRCWLYKRHGL